jgi:hypothetical protein
LSNWMGAAGHWSSIATITFSKRVDDRAACPCSKSRSNGAPTSVPRRRIHEAVEGWDRSGNEVESTVKL